MMGQTARIQAQAVLYHNEIASIAQTVEALANAVRYAREKRGLTVELSLAYGDSGDKPLLSEEDLDAFGAVSEPTAWQMAEGVRKLLGANLGVGITGIAGPNSDETNKPVGLVFIGVSNGQTILVREYHFLGDRAAVREHACAEAVDLLLGLVGK